MSEYAAYIAELNNLYNNGVDAYYTGPYDCPYDEGTPEWEAWCDGWDASVDSYGSGLQRSRGDG